MRGDQAGNASDPDFATSASADEQIPARDPSILQSARLRLASHYLASARHYREAISRHLMDDVRAVSGVIDAARSGADRSADALDVGAALVVLGSVRHRLDRLEADLLEAAQQVGLSWDVVTAIIGVPASDAQHRHGAQRNLR
ncbi:MAG: hypothetical protein ABSA03_02000 [Streptosporangiaceae bacterium]